MNKMNNIYYNKYLKYKQKYLSLKLQKGGKIMQTIIYKKDNTYYAELDGCEFLSFNLDNINLNNLDEFSKLCFKDEDKKKFIDFINENMNEKFVYLHDFYTLTLEHHKSLYEQINKINSDITIINKKEKINKIKLFEGKDINLEDISSIAGEILRFTLKSLYGNEIILCLEPILGDSPKSKSYGNMHLSNKGRYVGLINYYKKNIYTDEPKIYDCKTIFEQFNMLKNFGVESSLTEEETFKRKFIIGKLDLTKNIETKILKSTCESINILKWGFGIENEAGIYKNITEDGIINTFNNGNILIKIWDSEFESEIEEFDFKKRIKKIISNPSNFFEGNSNMDVMPESTTINPINMSIKKYIDEVIYERNQNLKVSEFMLKIMEFTDDKIQYYDGEIYEKIENIGINMDTGEEIIKRHYDYLGSYHFNITLPHLENIEHPDSSYDKEFLDRHINYARLLQWFEPLLLAVYGQPDFRSIGDKKQYSQASYRLFNSNTMFINTYNLEKGFDKGGRGLRDEKILVPKTPEEKYVNEELENRDNFFDYIKNNSNFDYISTNTDDYRERFKGFDLRRDTNAEGGKEFKSTYFGFEFRLMDYFPIEYLKEFCDLLWLIAFSFDNKFANNKELVILNATYNEKVYEQIVEVMKSGWNANIKENYKNELVAILLSLDINLSGCDITNAYTLLNSIYNKMIEKYLSIDFRGMLNNNILKSYKYILEELEIKDLECPNKIAKNKLIEYYINKLIKNEDNNKKIDNITNREDKCDTSDKLKKILKDLCDSELFKTKEEFIKYLEGNADLQDCLISDMDNLDKDNLYHYFTYLKSEKECKLYGDA